MTEGYKYSMYYIFDRITKTHYQMDQEEYDKKAFKEMVVKLFHNNDGTIMISSVFLGLNHGNSVEPILYETMVFLKTDQLQYRFRTYKETKKAHQKLCNIYLNGQKAYRVFK